MHEIISADTMKARVAEFHRNAERDALVRAARLGRARHRPADPREPRRRTARALLRLLVAIRAQ